GASRNWPFGTDQHGGSPPRPSRGRSMIPDRAVIRELVETALADEDLNTFCFDHFRAVYDRFTAGQERSAPVPMLVEYAGRHRQLDTLLKELQRATPGAYEEFMSRLGAGPALAPAPEPVRRSPRRARPPAPARGPSPPGPPVDFVIVTALEEERDAVLAKLPVPRQVPPTADDIRVYFAADLPVTFSDDTAGV